MASERSWPRAKAPSCDRSRASACLSRAEAAARDLRDAVLIRLSKHDLDVLLVASNPGSAREIECFGVAGIQGNFRAVAEIDAGSQWTSAMRPYHALLLEGTPLTMAPVTTTSKPTTTSRERGDLRLDRSSAPSPIYVVGCLICAVARRLLSSKVISPGPSVMYYSGLLVLDEPGNSAIEARCGVGRSSSRGAYVT